MSRNGDTPFFQYSFDHLYRRFSCYSVTISSSTVVFCFYNQCIYIRSIFILVQDNQ